MTITIEKLPKQYQEFASEYVTLRDGRRMTQLDAVILEAKDAAEIANTKVTKRLVITILQAWMQSETEA